MTKLYCVDCEERLNVESWFAAAFGKKYNEEVSYKEYKGNKYRCLNCAKQHKETKQSDFIQTKKA